MRMRGYVNDKMTYKVRLTDFFFIRGRKNTKKRYWKCKRCTDIINKASFLKLSVIRLRFDTGQTNISFMFWKVNFRKYFFFSLECQKKKRKLALHFIRDTSSNTSLYVLTKYSTISRQQSFLLGWQKRRSVFIII